MVIWVIKNLPAMQETQVRLLGREDPLDKEMATHSSILAWIIPWLSDERERESSVYFCHLFLISSASVRSLLFLSFLCLFLHEMFP